MKENAPSQFAIAAAVLRAIHMLWDADPKILADDLVGVLCGHGTDEALIADYRRKPETLRANRALLVVRARYAEGVLAAAKARGVDQYVIVAADLDLFALRQAELGASLDTYEGLSHDPAMGSSIASDDSVSR